MELCGLSAKRTMPKIVEFLSETALEALLAQPNIRKLTELRNRFFMILMYDTAARCQEMLDIRLKDFVLDAKAPFIYLTGKGNKTRAVLLMPATVRHFVHYISIFHFQAHHGSGDYLVFTTIHGKRDQMSPDTVACFMKKYGQSARTTCSDMPENVHPHQLRHTRAIHLYRDECHFMSLADLKSDYDYIIIDNNSQLGLLMINALATADMVIIPTKLEYPDLMGLTSLIKSIKHVKKLINRDLQFGGILVTMYTERTKLFRQILKQLTTVYGNRINIFESKIPMTVKISEANLSRKSVLEYCPVARRLKHTRNL